MAEIVILLLILLILGREYLSYKERKDLYNRLMAKSLDEVRVMEDSKPIPEMTESPPADYISMEDVSDEVFDDIIKADINQETTLKQKAIKKLKRKAQ